MANICLAGVCSRRRVCISIKKNQGNVDKTKATSLISQSGWDYVEQEKKLFSFVEDSRNILENMIIPAYFKVISTWWKSSPLIIHLHLYVWWSSPDFWCQIYESLFDLAGITKNWQSGIFRMMMMLMMRWWQWTLLRVYSVARYCAKPLSRWSYLIILSISWVRYYYFPHFVYKEIEAYRV